MKNDIGFGWVFSKVTRNLLFVVALAAGCSSSVVRAAVEVQATTLFEDKKLSLRVASGQIKLPAQGKWTVLEPEETGLEQVYLHIENSQALRGDGARKRALEIEQAVAQGQWRTASQFSLVQAFARNHDWRGPSSWEDTNFLDTVANYGQPWPADRKRDPKQEAEQIALFRESVTNLGLVPSASLRAGQRPISTNALNPVILELMPVKDDGQHWVVFSDGSSKRVPIDSKLLARCGFVISKKNVMSPDVSPRPTEQEIKIYALVRQQPEGPVDLQFKDARNGQTVKVTWDLRKATNGSSSSLSYWAWLRSCSWEYSTSPIVGGWVQRTPTLYGVISNYNRGILQPGFFNETPSLASLLGGRAAVQETLQMQAMGFSSQSRPGTRAVAVKSIPGVEVKSHRFAEMIKGKTNAPIKLADMVPRDRAFLYAAKPGTFADLFGAESSFVARSSAFGPTAGLDYHLLDRYTEELGLTPALRDLLLKNSSVSECALFVPDLFFVDGTDMTLIARAGKSSPLTKLIKPIISATSDAAGVSVVPTTVGKKAFWAVRDDLWFASTRRSELTRALDLYEAKGMGSLGQSDEFRYMLYKLPVTDKTRAYVYLSDPFIRRLVGPEVKIAQVRRISARMTMERMLAGALLRKLDQPSEAVSYETLAKLNYVDAQPTNDFVLNTNYTVASRAFGPLDRMNSLLAQNLTEVTPEEAEAYRRYVDNYSRMWRQYFDPIAIRLEGESDQRYILTTFILPLVDSTIYAQAREVLEQKGRVVRVPVFSKPPVALFSLALNDATWTKVSGALPGLVENYLGLSPELYDLMGPGIHLALDDSSPVIRFGSRDLTDTFSTSLGRGPGQEILVYAPVIVNMLTRPTTLAVELTNPDRARQLLEELSTRSAASDPAFASRNWMHVRCFQIENQPEWIVSLQLLGTASFDLSLRIEDRFLVIRNQPWSNRNLITGSRALTLSGAAVSFDTRALNESLPALFAGEAGAERDRTFDQMAALYPWIAALRCSVSEASKCGTKAFGVAPALDVSKVSWQNGELLHAIYGKPSAPQQPLFRTGTHFGLLDGVENATLEMQFEDDGLRTVVRWTLESAVPKK